MNTLTLPYQILLQTTTKELATPGNWPLTSLVHSVPETSMMVQSSKQRTKAKKVVILHWYSVPNAMIQQKEVNDFLQEKKRYTIKYLHSHKNEMTIPFIVRNQEALDSDFFYYDLNRSTSFPYVSRSPDCSKLEQINDNYQAIRSHERGRAKQRWTLL